MPIPAHALLAASGAPAPAQSLADAIASLTPIAYWPLNETSGTTATDAYASYDGTYAGTYTLNYETGPDGGPVARFNNGRVTNTNGSAFNRGTGGGPISVFALIKPDSVSGTGRRFVIAKGGASSTNYEYQLVLQDAQLAYFSFEDVGGTRIGKTSNGNVAAAGSWVACVGAVASGDFNASMYIYADSGSPLTTTTYTPLTSTGNNAANGALWIGDRLDSAATEFVGQIARVAVFGSMLSDADVGSLMDAATAEGWI